MKPLHFQSFRLNHVAGALAMALFAVAGGLLGNANAAEPGPVVSAHADAATTNPLSPAGIPLSTDASTTNSMVDPRALEVINAMQRRYEGVHSIYGEFGQISESEIFKEETKAEGRFWHVKPGKFRCEIEPPYDERTLITGNTAYYGVAENKSVEKYVFEDEEAKQHFLNRFLLGFGLTGEEILKSYKVDHLEGESTADTDALRFIPRVEDESGLDSITLKVKRKDSLPVEALIDYGESRTRILIKKLELNPEIPDNRFEPDFPANWDVVERH